MRSAIIAIAVGLALGSGARPRKLVAQELVHSGSLDSWSDSLAAAGTSAQLNALAEHLRDGPAQALRLVLFSIRQGELTRSRTELEAVAERLHAGAPRDRDSWSPYLLARVYAALRAGGWEPDGHDPGLLSGESYSEGVWRNLRIALTRDPSFELARRWFISLLVSGGDRILRDDQRITLQALVRDSPRDGNALLVWARHLRTVREYDSALVTFNRAAVAGADRSVVALERARTLRALHDATAAAASYWAGLEKVTPSGRALYRLDLQWLVGTDSIAAFDRVADSGLMAWMRRFWSERDAAAANRPGERLAEHLRRWVVAYARYRVLSPWRRTMHDRIDLFFDNVECSHLAGDFYGLLWKLRPSLEGDLRADEWLLDHRGVVYLRHGEPARTVGALMAGGPEDFVSGPSSELPDTTAVWSPWSLGKLTPRLGVSRGPASSLAAPTGPPRQPAPRFAESWLYLINGEPAVVHFRDSYALGMYAATTLTSVVPYSVSQWSDALTRLLPAYRGLAMRIAPEQRKNVSARDPMARCWNEFRAANIEAVADATNAVRQDSDAPPFEVLWRTGAQMFAIGDGRNEPSEVVVATAINSDSLHAERLADGRSLYELHFRVVAWEYRSGQTVELDTTRRFVRDTPIPRGADLVSFLEFPLAPGDWQVAMRATQHGEHQGAFVLRRGLHVDSAGAMNLGDLVLGVAGEPSWRATDGDPFPINVEGVWRTDDNAELLFDVLGLSEGTQYHTTIELERVVAAKPKGVALKIGSADRATRSVMHVRRSLSLSRLQPGEYRLSVILESGGRRAMRSRLLRIIPATLPTPAPPAAALPPRSPPRR